MESVTIFHNLPLPPLPPDQSRQILQALQHVPIDSLPDAVQVLHLLFLGDEDILQGLRQWRGEMRKQGRGHEPLRDVHQLSGHGRDRIKRRF